MNEENKKEEKERKKTEKENKKLEKKKKKKVIKELKKVSKEKEEIVRIRKKRHILETIIIIIFSIFMLILLCNRTFFREEYRTDKISLDLPLLTFFVKDDGNEIILKTLRKSDYLKEYFDSYLSTLARYSCQEENFYYDQNTHTAIYEISVEKNIAVKTIRIRYTNGDENCLCEKKAKCE